jgi:hypothetical protein
MMIAAVALLAMAGFAQSTRTLPQGAEIKVRTDTAIPAEPAANSTYAARISRDVIDSSGADAIPAGAQAQLVAIPTSDGKDTVLDLTSVTMGGTSAPGNTWVAGPPSAPS